MLNRNKNNIYIEDYFPLSALRMVSWCPSNLSQSNKMLPINIWTHLASLKFNMKILRSWDPASSFMVNKRRKGGNSDRFLHLTFRNHCGWCLQPWNQRMFASWQECYDKHKQCVEKQKHHSAQQTGRCLAFSFGFLKFLSSPHWSLKSLSFLVLQDSQDYFPHFFTQSRNQPSL